MANHPNRSGKTTRVYEDGPYFIDERLIFGGKIIVQDMYVGRTADAPPERKINFRLVGDGPFGPEAQGMLMDAWKKCASHPNWRPHADEVAARAFLKQTKGGGVLWLSARDAS